jgi:GNAT superfamily N-acetyltransferase
VAGGQSEQAGHGRRPAVIPNAVPWCSPPSTNASGGFDFGVSSSSRRSAADQFRGLLARARDVGRLLQSGNASKAWWALAYRVYSDSISLGMRRDISVPFTGPQAKIPITVRPLAPADDLSALDPAPGISADEAFWRLGQRRLLQSGLQTCYVALSSDGKVSYMQWLIPASENARLRSVFGNLYPVLGPDEALLEGAYTPDAYRGKGIMGAAMSQIAERARDFGARWVITFVDATNDPSIKGCVRAGFQTYLKRHERFRFFFRQIRFQLIPPSEAPPGESRRS